MAGEDGVCWGAGEGCVRCPDSVSNGVKGVCVRCPWGQYAWRELQVGSGRWTSREIR